MLEVDDGLLIRRRTQSFTWSNPSLNKPYQICKDIQCEQSYCVHDDLKSKKQNSLKDRHRSGRPKITNAQTDVDIVGHFRDNTFKTVRSAVGETGLKKDTILRRLFAAGLRSYRPVIKPKLTDTHKQNRLQWAKHHIRWTLLQ